MRSFDLSPLFRSTVGYDRLNSLFEMANRASENAASYPPYNIEKVSDDEYRVVMAVAGFGEQDIDITYQSNLLTVSGKLEDESGSDENRNRSVLYRGIAARAFEHRFQLADHIKVADARLINGLLEIDLVREVPEEMKPRKIEIGGVKQIEKQAA